MSAVRDLSSRLAAAAPSLRPNRVPAAFPSAVPASPAAFLREYRRHLDRALASVPEAALSSAVELIGAALARDATIFTCGNGGSAAIANHFVCDFGKGLATDTPHRARIRSLSASAELLTAIANDIDYADIFAHQLAGAARPGDLLIAISSSGNSENIVRALQWGHDNGLATIALTGFSGGRGARLADVNLHVAAQNYGIVEDAHQALMHILAQYLRATAMPADLIAQRRF